MNGTAIPFIVTYYTGTVYAVNFGQRAWYDSSSVPSGYKALCTQNLPAGPVGAGRTYFDIQLYEGNGASTASGSGGTQDFSNFLFEPSFVWIKDRTQNGHNNNLVDAVRGAPNLLLSDSTNTEITNSPDGFTGFTSDGFTLGDNGEGTQSLELNKNGNNYVAWSWAGGSSNTSISAGGLDSSVYNTSRVWSDGIANSDSDFDLPKTNAFNGNRGDKLRTGGNSVLVTLNFSPALTVASTVEILGEDYPTANFRYTVTVDGVTTTKDIGLGKPGLFNVSGSLTQITFDNNSGSGRTYLEWIRVDGKELINNGVTPPQVPSIPTTLRALPEAGFSIVTYTGNSTSGATVAHGLNAKAELILLKARNSGENWFVNFPLGTGDGYLMLNQTNDGDGANSTVWNSTDPTSSVFSLGNSSGVNAGYNYVAYCFASVEGYSKFGNWTNNNSTSGQFVYTGFRPRMILLKNTDNVENWYIIDTSRSDYNGVTPIVPLQPNTANNEANADAFNATATVDILSNGFKIYTTNPSSGEISYQTRSYAYGAWAEHPFKSSRAR